MCKNKIYKSEIILKPFFGLFHGSAFLDRGNLINATKVHSDQPINNIQLTFSSLGLLWAKNKNDMVWSQPTVFRLNMQSLDAVKHIFCFSNIVNRKATNDKCCWPHLSASRAAPKLKWPETSLTPVLHLWRETKTLSGCRQENGLSDQPINNHFLLAIWFIYFWAFLDRGNQYS